MGVEVTFRCGGCEAVAEGTQPIHNRFHGFNGKGHGFGVRSEDKASSVAPEGWCAFDPWTQCTYCPDCWRELQAEIADRQKQEQTI